MVSLGYPNGCARVVGDEWKRMKLSTSRSGHLCVGLSRGGKSFTRFAHRLVLEAFVGPRPPGMVARHFPDRNPANNRLDNLSWGTVQDNHDDQRVHGTILRGERHPMAKTTESVVRAIRADYEQARGDRPKAPYGTSRRLAAKHGVDESTVYLIVTNKIWSHVV